MKRYLIIFVLFMCSAVVLFGQEPKDSDTVWVNKIGSEVKNVKFSPDGQFIYAAALGRKPLKLSTETGEILKEYDGLQFSNDARWTPLDISTDGKWLISGDYGNELKIWDTETGLVVKTLNTNNTESQNNKFNTVSISPDKRFVFATNMYWIGTETFIQSILIWDLESGELLKEIQSRFVTKVVASPDNKYFAVSYERSEGSKILPSEIDLYEMGTLNKIITLGKHDSKVSDISFSRDGTLLASCGWDGVIKIWDVEQKKMVNEIKDEYYGYSIGFIDNFKIIYGGGFFDQKFMKIFNLQTNEILGRIKIDHPIELDINNTKHYCVVANSDYILLFDYLVITGINNSNSTSTELIKPNPTKNNTEINISILINGNYDITVFDNNSQKIDVIYNGFLEMGVHTFTWNASKYPSGTYFCKITSNTFSKTYKIMVMK